MQGGNCGSLRGNEAKKPPRWPRLWRCYQKCAVTAEQKKIITKGKERIQEREMTTVEMTTVEMTEMVQKGGKAKEKWKNVTGVAKQDTRGRIARTTRNVAFSAKQQTMTLTNVKRDCRQSASSATRRGTVQDGTEQIYVRNATRNIREYKDADDRQSR